MKLLAPFGVQHRYFDAGRENAPLTGYYSGLLPLMSVGQVDAKMRELAAQPDAELLIPDGPLACSYDLTAERRAIRLATLALFYSATAAELDGSGAVLRVCAGALPANGRGVCSGSCFALGAVRAVIGRGTQGFASGEEGLLDGAIVRGGWLARGADVAGKQGVGGAGGEAVAGACLGDKGAEMGAVLGGGEIPAGEATFVVACQCGKVLTNETQESWT